MLEVRYLALGQFLEHALLHPEHHLGRSEQAGHVEAGRAARGADLGVILRGGAGRVVDHLDAELLLEGLDHHFLDQLLVLTALRVDDQRFLGARGDHVRRRNRECRAALEQLSAFHDSSLPSSITPSRYSERTAESESSVRVSMPSTAAACW